MASDGMDAASLFNMPCTGYELSDLASLPQLTVHNNEDVDLTTRFSRNVVLRSPFVSAPLGAVSGGRMAITCALLGGIGVIHCGGTAEEQAHEISVVKGHGHGFIMDPNVLRPDHTVEDADRLTQLTGSSTVLLTDGGRMGNRLLGIVTRRDLESVEDRTTMLADVMTPMDAMVVGVEPISEHQAQDKLRASRKGKLPVVDDEGRVMSLVSRGDFKKSRAHPLACRDHNKQLLVAAAVKPGDSDRATKLVEAGVDVLVLDAAQGDSTVQLHFLMQVKQKYPHVDVICGNVVSVRQARSLLDAGADGLRVGMGCSSMFAATAASAIGRPQGSAIYHVAKCAVQYQVPVCADGGIVSSSAASMALTLGASTVMLGSLLAGTSETPGEGFYRDGVKLKSYGGSGVLDVLPAAPTGQAGIPQGMRPAAQISRGPGPMCSVVEKGPAKDLLKFLLDGVRNEMRKISCGSIDDLHGDLYEGRTRFHVRTVGARGPMAAH